MNPETREGVRRCETCGGPVRVVGSVTKHYEPIDLLTDLAEELEARAEDPGLRQLPKPSRTAFRVAYGAAAQLLRSHTEEKG